MWLCSGDDRITVEAVGKSVGIEPCRVVSQLQIIDRPAFVKKLRRTYSTHNTDDGCVCVVGVDRTPDCVIASADVGVVLNANRIPRASTPCCSHVRIMGQRSGTLEKEKEHIDWSAPLETHKYPPYYGALKAVSLYL